jgi:hypothetical protein
VWFSGSKPAGLGFGIGSMDHSKDVAVTTEGAAQLRAQLQRSTLRAQQDLSAADGTGSENDESGGYAPGGASPLTVNLIVVQEVDAVVIFSLFDSEDFGLSEDFSPGSFGQWNVVEVQCVLGPDIAT